MAFNVLYSATDKSTYSITLSLNLTRLIWDTYTMLFLFYVSKLNEVDPIMSLMLWYWYIWKATNKFIDQNNTPNRTI